jgi:hypothetical protein
MLERVAAVAELLSPMLLLRMIAVDLLACLTNFLHDHVRRRALDAQASGTA